MGCEKGDKMEEERQKILGVKREARKWKKGNVIKEDTVEIIEDTRKGNVI